MVSGRGHRPAGPARTAGPLRSAVRTGVPTVVLGLVLTLLPALTPTATAAAPATLATPATPATPATTAAPATDAQVSELAARVAALTQEYRDRSATAVAAARRLAAAYTGIATADADARAADAEVAVRRGELADRARQVYIQGAAAHGGLALLTADTVQDALWRLSMGHEVAQRQLAETARLYAEADEGAAGARRRSAAALAAADGIGALLTSLHTEEDDAAWALAQARGELSRLQAIARDAELARQAAERLDAARRDAEAARLPSSGPVGALSIPAGYERAYRAAATTCPGLDWTLLAAVGQVESGHGRNNGPSSAGAIGPMQFMPATFAAYAVDGDGDQVTDPWNPADAIPTAARYLCASGAGRGVQGVHDALLTYNHAEWYVDLVLAAQAAIIAAHPR